MIIQDSNSEYQEVNSYDGVGSNKVIDNQGNKYQYDRLQNYWIKIEAEDRYVY